MTTMIALVGDQPLPNFLPVRHFHYDKVLLVYTHEKEQQYKNLAAALQKEPHITVEKVETEAYYIHQIAQTLHEELTYLGWEYPEQLVFNLTGGTKAMSLAASLVAQWRSAETLYVTSQDTEVYAYHSLWSDNQIQPLGKEVLPGCIELSDVCDLHLGAKRWREYGPSKDIGGRFETLLVNTLRKYENPHKIIQVSEVRAGIKTLNNQVDMDIVVRFGNHYGIIEAKSGNSGTGIKAIQQLSTSKPLLGTYSRAFSVITVPANPDHQELLKALDFKVISLPSYNETGQEISVEDELELMTRIEYAFHEPVADPDDL